MEGGCFSLKTVDPIINTKNTAMSYCAYMFPTTILAHAYKLVAIDYLCFLPYMLALFTCCDLVKEAIRNILIFAKYSTKNSPILNPQRK